MRCLVLGATGMLGQALMAEAAARGIEVRGASRSGPDLTLDVRDERTLQDAFDRCAPEVIINSAAIVDLGLCESDPCLAHHVNARPVAFLAELCRRDDARLVQISTDHYFTGDGREQHDEQSQVWLVNEYARSKFAGEAYALTDPRSLVIRTNVTGYRGRSEAPTFIEWAVAAIESAEPVTLFEDFYTSTMAASHCAGAVFDLVERQARGVFNVAAAEVASKQEFVAALASALELPLPPVTPGSVRGLVPQRAESLGLDVSRVEAALERPMPDLRDTVAALAATRPLAA